jgi:hypothetical protein
LFLVVGSNVQGQAPASANESLKRFIADYVAAWNGRDFDALRRLWTDDGEMIDARGVVVDRETLLARKAPDGADGKSVLSVKIGAVRQIEPNVVLVDGESNLANPAGAVFEHMRFSGILVNKDGSWRIRLIRELSSEQPPPEAPLRDLEWLIGDWVGMGEGLRVEIGSQWDMEGRYVLSNFEIEPEGGNAYEATQRIAWDPASRSIKSWYFDSRGSISTGAWERNGESWLVTITGTQYDGAVMTGTSVITPIDNDSYLRTLVNVHVAGNTVPAQELRLFRIAPQAAE